MVCSNAFLHGQSKAIKRPPNLPTNIPPPPNFGGSSSESGKFQIVSGEYYSQDARPILYKRLIKINTLTGEAWVLQSKKSKVGEVRKWVPLEN